VPTEVIAADDALPLPLTGVVVVAVGSNSDPYMDRTGLELFPVTPAKAVLMGLFCEQSPDLVPPVVEQETPAEGGDVGVATMDTRDPHAVRLAVEPSAPAPAEETGVVAQDLAASPEGLSVES